MYTICSFATFIQIAITLEQASGSPFQEVGSSTLPSSTTLVDRPDQLAIQARHH